MKELSIEEKAKRYDEAIERSKNYYSTTDSASDIKLIGLIFPELKESKGEKIRKRIIDSLHGDVLEMGEIKKAIAWLEKQGEQKPYGQRQECVDCQFNYAGECKGSCAMKRGEQKSTDKVEPKFEIEEGKWYVCIRDLLDNYANKAFCKGDIYLSTQNGSLIPSNSNVPFEVVCPDTYFKDWTIQDAKDGDVLVASDGSIFLFKGTIDWDCKHYVALTTDGDVKFNEGLKHFWETSTAVHPATKEQRDLLFQKMKEAGYEWNSKKKELKKIELKYAWSEEDARMLNEVILDLKVLKDKDSGEAGKAAYQREIDCLKSLKERYAWKPSDKQMLAINTAINVIGKGTINGKYLVELHEQLKKLREE